MARLARRGSRSRSVPAGSLGALLAAASLGCSAPSDPPGPPPRPHVLIYLVDTLRADALGCYGRQPSITPEIDAFAAEATLFEQALAASPWTRASVASLLTGWRSGEHGVDERDDALSDSATTLAELLGDEGYETAAFTTNANAGRQFGFAQGFETFELLGITGGEQLHHLSDALNRRAFEWLDRRADRPFLLYLHTIDPHAPYAPPAAFRRRFAASATTPALAPETRAALAEVEEKLPTAYGPEVREPELGSMLWMHGLFYGAIPMTEAMTGDLKALYEAEVAYNDRSFGALLDGLRERGLYRDTLVVFASDHGEEFDEHGLWEHGKQLFAESVRIPLIVRVPGQGGGVRRAPEVAELVDVVPTLLDFLEIESGADLPGRSLLAGSPRRDGGVTAVRLDGREASAYVEWPWKLILRRRPQEERLLFDLAEDPAERTDLAERHPDVVSRLTAALTAEERRSGREPRAEAAEIDDELRERLRAMGYGR